MPKQFFLLFHFISFHSVPFDLVTMRINGNVCVYLYVDIIHIYGHDYITQADLHGLCISFSFYSKFTIRSRLDKPMDVFHGQHVHGFNFVLGVFSSFLYLIVIFTMFQAVHCCWCCLPPLPPTPPPPLYVTTTATVFFFYLFGLSSQKSACFNVCK